MVVVVVVVAVEEEEEVIVVVMVVVAEAVVEAEEEEEEEGCGEWKKGEKPSPALFLSRRHSCTRVCAVFAPSIRSSIRQ